MKKIINKNKWMIYIICIFIIAFSNFLYFNFDSIKTNLKNEKIINYNFDIIDYKGFKKENGYLISNKKKPSITIVADKYINKLQFNYKSKENYKIKEKIEYFNSFGKIKSKSNEYQKFYGIDESTIDVRKTVHTIKYTFYDYQNPIKIKNIRINNRLYFNFYSFLLFSVIFSIIYILLVKKEYFVKNIHKGFLLISISFGFLFLILIPPVTGASSDDQIHFRNVYDLTNLKEIKDTNASLTMKNLTIDSSKIKSVEERKEIIKYINKNNSITKIEEKDTSLISYKKLVYLPSTLIFKLASLLGFPFIACFILGKMINIFIYSFTISYAIKITPICKKLLTFIGLLPTTIFFSSQYSYDNMVTPFIILSFSIFLYEIINKNKKLELKNVLLFIIAVLVASLAKAVYAPMLLLFLLLPKEKFKTEKQKKIFKFGILIICLSLMATFILPTVSNPIDDGDSRGGVVSIAGQIHTFIQNPISFIKAFSYNVIYNFSDRFFSEWTLNNMVYFGFTNSKNIILLTLVLLIFITITDTNKNISISKKDKIKILLILTLIICFIWGSMYLAFTPVGDIKIKGVVGRYFLPLLFSLLVCFNSNKIICNIKESKYIYLIYFASIIILSSSICLNILLPYCM